MTAVMVQGCTSWAGKSLLTTALCRWYANRGLRVAPFKGQNMSNNARVVDGGELGVAQWLQAKAARVEPDVRMGPVLVKPERSGSQVVVLGQVNAALSARGWTQRPTTLWPTIAAALDELLKEYDLVVSEGAGSPAEINLMDTDLANMRVAHHADASVLLVADIDRGGAFAHLFGTWSLLPASDRVRLSGFVLNRFRGDIALLRDGPSRLAALTGMAYAGTLPMLQHRLADEDGARDLVSLRPAGDSVPIVAVVRYPTASNLDELVTLATACELRWAHQPSDLVGADLVLLPGSKHVSSDFAWLLSSGMGVGVVAAVRAGTRVVGVCGGLQLLGEWRSGGAGGLEEAGPGLGLLPVTTAYADEKLVRRVRTAFAVDLPAAWSDLAGVRIEAYDIRHGSTSPLSGSAVEVLPGGLGWAVGSVLGLACHGVLESPEVVHALLGPDSTPVRHDLDAVFDDLAAAVDNHLDVGLLERLAGGLL